MAKGGKGGSKSKPRFSEEAVAGRKASARRNSVAVKNVEIADDSDDEDAGLPDAFQEKRDKISLQVSDDDEFDDEEDEDVMGLGESDEDEDDDIGEGDEELDDDDLLEAAIQRGGRLGMLAKQAKQLGQKLKLQQGEDDGLSDDDDEDDQAVGKKGKKKSGGSDDDDDGPSTWGSNKRAYYDDGSDEPEDEEAAREEEEEVMRLQKEMAKKTTAADYGLEDDDEDEDEDESDEEDDEEEDDEGTLGAAARKAQGKASDTKPKKGSSSAAVAVETLDKQLTALSADERAAALMADAPELAALLEELTTALHEVRHRIGPLVQEVRAGKLATKEGLSYLEAKHLLLLQYALHIVFYLLLKAEGRSVKDHPVITRLVEIRAYLEKIRPIDKQLAYQIDKLLRAAAAAQVADGTAPAKATTTAAAGDEDEDELAAAPRPGALMSRQGAAAAAAGGAYDDGDAAAGGGGVYRPPKLNPVTMEDDEDRKRAAKMSRDDKRMLAEARRRASRSDALADLAAEVAGAPEEVRASLPGFDTLSALRMKQKLEARSREEEDAFIRVPLSKDQAKALRSQRRQGLSAAALMGDFADEVADLVDATGGQAAGSKIGGGLADVFARQKVSQKFGAELTRPALHGGDEDLPKRATLGERRAHYDAIAAKRSARAASEDGDDDMEFDLAPGRGKRRMPAGEEDDFYAQAKEAAAERKRSRAESHRAPATLPPMPDQDAGDYARPISYEIQKNRGLTPHRRKDLKNPRKKNRVKFAKALVRRSGAVQDGSANRPGGNAAYAGEATGVKSKITKSRKL